MSNAPYEQEQKMTIEGLEDSDVKIKPFISAHLDHNRFAIDEERVQKFVENGQERPVTVTDRLALQVLARREVRRLRRGNNTNYELFAKLTAPLRAKQIIPGGRKRHAQ